MEKLASGLACR